MSDLEKRVAALEKENAEMKEIFYSLHDRINQLIELGYKAMDTEIKNLEDAYDYEKQVKAVFDKIGIKYKP